MIRLHPAARVAGVVAALLACAFPVAGAESGWAVDMSGGHTDNARRTETGRVSDTILTAGVAATFKEQTRRLKASIEGSGTWFDYLDDTYDDDFLASGQAELVFGVVPDRFLWSVEDTLRQIAVDLTQPVTPENRQSANVFRTGPDFIFRLSDRSEVTLGSRFTKTAYEETTRIDDTQISGELRWLRRVSSATAWGAVASHQHVEYDAPEDPAYEQQELYGTLQSDGARQAIRLDIGATRLSGDAGSGTSTNPLLRVSLSRQLRRTLVLGLNFGSEYRNSSDRFSRDSLVVAPGPERVVLSAVPAQARFGDVKLSLTRPRTSVDIGASYSREKPVAGPGFEERLWRLSAGASRSLRPTLRGFVNYGYEDRQLKFTELQADQTQVASLGLDWRVGRSTFITVGYRREDREGTLGTGTYVDNLFQLRVAYRNGALAETDGQGPGGF